MINMPLSLFFQSATFIKLRGTLVSFSSCCVYCILGRYWIEILQMSATCELRSAIVNTVLQLAAKKSDYLLQTARDSTVEIVQL